mmetsp:Transcript_42106/g.95159  ORF Transcript_42106/g.95159 Transcript_42106/m.95159 type:complete len:234 (+) Transcript_42106:165-866(+)
MVLVVEIDEARLHVSERELWGPQGHLRARRGSEGRGRGRFFGVVQAPKLGWEHVGLVRHVEPHAKEEGLAFRALLGSGFASWPCGLVGEFAEGVEGAVGELHVDEFVGRRKIALGFEDRCHSRILKRALALNHRLKLFRGGEIWGSSHFEAVGKFMCPIICWAGWSVPKFPGPNGCKTILREYIRDRGEVGRPRRFKVPDSGNVWFAASHKAHARRVAHGDLGIGAVEGYSSL